MTKPEIFDNLMHYTINLVQVYEFPIKIDGKLKGIGKMTIDHEKKELSLDINSFVEGDNLLFNGYEPLEEKK